LFTKVFGAPRKVIHRRLRGEIPKALLATYDGVVRFDGVRFVRIGPDDPTNQLANRVLCLHVGRGGQLWLGTDGAGLMRYAAGNFTAFLQGKEGTPVNCVRSVVEDVTGDLWLGTQGGLGRFKDGKATWFTTANGFTNAVFSVWNMAFDREGRLWIADWTSLKAFKEGRFETPLLSPPPRPPVRAVYADDAGNMWAGMMGHAWQLGNQGQWTSLADVERFARLEVTAFCQTRAGEIWVGTRRGLFCWRNERWAAFTVREGSVSTEVRVLFEDREGNLWVGTGTGGLARLKRRVLKTYTARNGLTDGGVLALREKPDGGLWVGLSDGRLAHGSAGAFHRFEAKGLPADAPVKAVLCTREGALWVGTFGSGLVRLQESNLTQFTPSVGSPARIDKITALLEDRAGEIWIGSFYGLYKATGSNVVVPVLVGGRELRAPVTALVEDNAGGMWVGCHGLGVVRLARDQATWVTRRDGLPTALIRTLHQDRTGTVWIGTEAGLCSWRSGRVSRFTKAHGLVDDTISQILEDDADNLWLGSNRGIMRVAKRELLAIAQGRNALLEVFACGQGDGMLSLECLGGFCPAGLKTSDGKLWFPTAKGLVMVDPSQLKLTMNSTPPPVYIEEVRADGKLVARPHSMPVALADQPSPPAPVVLPPSARRLEFIYTGLSLTAPERVRFKHRLEGFDADWMEAGTVRSVVYAKLPPGRYRFQVIACNNDGVWNETGHLLPFRIAAPFWQTWWFPTFAGLGSAGALSGAVRFISVRQLRRKLRRLEEAHAIEKERMRIAQDMHDEIGGKLSRISFLSDMARRHVSEMSEASQQIDEVSEAARDVIRTVDEIVWAVSPRNDTLESLTHYICRHAEEFFELTPVELELELPGEFPARRLSADVRHNLFCAVKEALNNVLKHAGATKVRIAFVASASSFQVTVRDDGSGFRAEEVLAAALHTGNGADTARRGNGLLNMRERLESIRGKCVLKSQPGKGARAMFSVPLD
jgi:ligand-binding sensor domain-containing protein/signal transduction histidine kinase